MHSARLRCENSKYREYSCVFAPGRTGAYTAKSVNLFLREPLGVRASRLLALGRRDARTTSEGNGLFHNGRLYQGCRRRSSAARIMAK